MTPEFVSQVFDTFSRAKATDDTAVEGTGHGMAIAKNLVELMGGTIACDSTLGSGTTFTVTVPMLSAAAVGEAAGIGNYERINSLADDTNNQIVDLSGKRILLVEDNAINREIARKIIGETKAEVIEAVNSQAAVDIFGRQPVGFFDLILMNLQMPVMNGYEATAAIRSQDRQGALTIPIYAMTANTFDEDVRQVKDAGMNGHISKPYTPAALYKVLGQALADK